MHRNLKTSTRFCDRRICGGVLAALLTVCECTLAAGPAPAARYQIEQPARPLSESLLAIARQTGASVLFDPTAVRGITARAVSGQLSAAEAIERALDGTGLTVEITKDGAIVVRRPSVAMVVDAPASQVAAGTVQVLAQAATSTGSDAGTGAAMGAAAAQPGPTTIEITGSRLKRVLGEGPLPVNTYTKDDIDKSGQPSLERFLSSLTEASVTPGEGGLSSTTGQGSVQLRGLPVGSTLVLINGRRVQAVGSSSANIFNLNLIPLAAIERVEIVPVGSSAVYGGDALAGVVNVILKKTIDGVALAARVGGGKGISDHSVSLATGGSDDKGSFMVLGAFSKTTPLTAAERDFFKDADYRRYGGTDARSRLCIPGTVTSTTTANLPGLNSTFAGIPQTAPGQPLSIASFSATAGQANLCNGQATGNGYALIHGTEAAALHASADRLVVGTWSVFGELTHTRDRLRAVEGGLQLNNVLVPAANPNNPFGVPVRVTARLSPDNGSEGFVRNTDFTRALAGARGELTAGWDAEATVSTSRDSGKRLLLNGTTNTTARTAALAAPSQAAALNPFTTGRAASDDVLRAIWSDAVRSNRGQKDQVGAFVRGPVAELPAGPVNAIVGGEFAQDRYVIVQTGADHNDRRNASALYGEFQLPLLRAGAATGPGWNVAALTLAGRHDKYSDFGTANTYQLGAEVRPAQTMLLRASAATSFKPPTLLQTNINDSEFAVEAFGLLDPLRANAPITGATVERTANRSLQPEQGKAYSLGAVWEPQAALGSRLGVTAWRVNIDGLIALLFPQVTLNNESLFPGLVTRAPAVNGVPGPVTRVLYTEVNFGRVQTAGIDFEAMQAWHGPGGRWTVSANATRTSKYDVVLAPGAAAEDRLGRRAADFWSPRWKARLAAGLDAGAWSVNLGSRYLGAYKDAGTSVRRLGDTWVHDVSGKLDLMKLGLVSGLGPKAASLSLGIVNVTNRQPQFVSTTPFYDITQADWRGRYGSVRLSVDW